MSIVVGNTLDTTLYDNIPFFEKQTCDTYSQKSYDTEKIEDRLLRTKTKKYVPVYSFPKSDEDTTNEHSVYPKKDTMSEGRPKVLEAGGKITKSPRKASSKTNELTSYRIKQLKRLNDIMKILTTMIDDAIVDL